MDHSLNSLNNFDFLARSFARMHAEGRPVDILAITGNMDEEHRTWFCARYTWFCARYTWYCQQMMQTRELELEH
ncbi:cell surface composition regulator GlgS [Escherichia albertii]|nr:cell surface composition regulator GlgS [Escherichia albertii]MCZ8960692.1 cell surface composition regulator GlgS [Escherichia albertii]MCZ9014615.1 cell surface composition regulator GlgS [Escherichia albertii]MCZ9133142.1 cell surface composition regulator GlgS [Escherichia albertii]